MTSLPAYADAARRSALALHLVALLGEIPDWLVLTERVPRPQHTLRPGRGYLGWESEEWRAVA